MSTFKPSEIVVAVDIGTTKVCAIAGRMNQYGRIEVLGMGKVKSEGVNRGVVSNIAKTVHAIKEAVAIAEKSAQIKFEKVHVGIAGQHIKSLHHHGLKFREDSLKEISQEDVDSLINDMYRLVLPPGDKILHVIPQEFSVDEEQDIIDPVGMSGIRLEANFHIITGRVTASKNIQTCIERVGLELQEMTLEPIASAEAVLTDQEKEVGVALVDIGGGTTDITIIKDGIIRHTAVIPFGGQIITKDIKEGCSVMEDQAEKLKVKFGSALEAEVHGKRIITIPVLNGRDTKEISERNLARIIQARVAEIFDFVAWEIKRSGYDKKLGAGLVLTGGGSLLRHIDLLAAYHTGMASRIGLADEKLAHKYDELSGSPIFATAVGLLINGISKLSPISEVEESKVEQVEQKQVKEIEEKEIEEDSFEEELEDEKPQGKWYETILNKAYDFFDSTPDSKF